MRTWHLDRNLEVFFRTSQEIASIAGNVRPLPSSGVGLDLLGSDSFGSGSFDGILQVEAAWISTVVMAEDEPRLASLAPT